MASSTNNSKTDSPLDALAEFNALAQNKNSPNEAEEEAAAAPSSPKEEEEEKATTPAFSPINVGEFESMEQLHEAHTPDHLKHELARLGLKCGGTSEQRASRLFLLKNTPLENLARKHFAKKRKRPT